MHGRDTSPVASWENMNISGIIQLNANDTVELWVWNDLATNDVIIDDVTLSLIQISGLPDPA